MGKHQKLEGGSFVTSAPKQLHDNWLDNGNLD